MIPRLAPARATAPPPPPPPAARAAWPAIQILPTGLPGCFELRPHQLRDPRGSFAKIFHRPLWAAHGLCTDYREEFLTCSGKDVLRGLHFQTPPMQHTKVVICLHGRVLDVALDLRVHSPTYRRHISLELSGDLGNALYLPPGVAHGFCVTQPDAVLYYKVSSIYSPAHDAGVRWDSAGIAWPVPHPLLSDRDRQMIELDDFVSPFTHPSP